MPAKRRPHWSPSQGSRSHGVPPEERPIQVFRTTLGFGNLVFDIRRELKIRQEDLALRAQVSRQWIIDLERGKPTLEMALVLRVLEALGFEFFVRPGDVVPSWIVCAKAAAAARHRDMLHRRNERRPHTRAQARAQRIVENYPRVRLDLE